jgi:hypothetical protein
MEQVPFRDRARTQFIEDLTVTVVALGPDESQKIFGTNLSTRGIQPASPDACVGQVSKDTVNNHSAIT